MQPYLFPYIGYWQLINSVDKFIILDDVNFIKKGFINRNSILVNGQSHLFTIPLDKPSQNKLIKDTQLNFSEKDKEQFKKKIQLAYGKAPYYREVMPLLELCIQCEKENLTDFIANSIKLICTHLDIMTEIEFSSTLSKNNNFSGQKRIIYICNNINASQYVNPIGGIKLYSQEAFALKKIKLFFLQPCLDKVNYRQFTNSFVPNLSIIDVLMFNQKEQVKKYLDCYLLLES